jgi:hypothetical protein
MKRPEVPSRSLGIRADPPACGAEVGLDSSGPPFVANRIHGR